MIAFLFKPAPFPVTSNIWWGIVSWLLIIAAVMIVVGESLALLGVRNFSFYTYYIRWEVPRPVLITLIALFAALAAFIVWHFGWGRTVVTGPNHGL